MLSFILAFLLLALIFAGLICFPYKTVGQWLKEHFHLRTFFAGILLTVFGLISSGEPASAPSTNEMGDILSGYSGNISQICIVIGILCFIASFFINRFFSDHE